MGCVASHSVVSVSSFNPSHPDVSGVSECVSGQVAWLRGPLCGVSLLPFPPSVCRVRLLPFGAAFGFLGVPEEMSLKAPFRFPLAVPLPELPLAPMVVGAVVRCPPTGS